MKKIPAFLFANYRALLNFLILQYTIKYFLINYFALKHPMSVYSEDKSDDSNSVFYTIPITYTLALV